jgi:hypothetical protein
MDWNKFIRNTKHEKHIPLGAPPNPGGLNPITGNTFAGGASGPAVTPAYAQGLQGCFGLNYAEVSVTSAQILLLQTTPVTIVPAPGAGFAIVPIVGMIKYVPGTVAYTNAGGAMQLQLGAVAAAQALQSTLLTAVAPARTFELIGPMLYWSGAAGQNPPSNENVALVLNKITNQFAAGNGTLKVECWYAIENTQ